MKIHFLYFKAENDDLFKNSLEKPPFVLRPLNAVIKSVVDRLYLQKLEY